MRSCRTNLGAALLAGGLGAAAMFGAERSAQAQLNAGAEVGLAYRASDPTLKPGMAAGAHAEYKLIPMLAVGPYFLWYDLLPDGANINSNATFVTWGGRVRFTLPLPGSKLRPYAFAGLGRTGVTYPAELINSGMYGSTRTTDFAPRSGWFLEVPVGLGLGYQVVRLAQITADFALREGFNFKGDAYEGNNPMGKPTTGFTVMLGGALDF